MRQCKSNTNWIAIKRLFGWKKQKKDIFCHWKSDVAKKYQIAKWWFLEQLSFLYYKWKESLLQKHAITKTKYLNLSGKRAHAKERKTKYLSTSSKRAHAKERKIEKCWVRLLMGIIFGYISYFSYQTLKDPILLKTKG